MTEYILLLIIVFFLALLGMKYNKELVLKVICLILVLFSGFRCNVGADYPNYVDIYNGVGYHSAREIGFQVLIDFLKFMGGTPQLLFFVVAFIIQLMVFKIIKYYSVNYMMSILIFILIPPFYLGTFNGLRQFAAIAIFFYSIRFLDQNNLKTYFLINILAAFIFHESVIFVTALFPFITKPLSVKKKVILFVGVVFMSFSLDVLIGYTPYGNYLLMDKKVVVGNLTYVLFGFASIMILIDKKLPDFKHKATLMNFNFFGFLTLFVVLIQSKDVLIQMFMRFNNYFFFSFFVLVPSIISCIKNPHTKLLSFIFVILFSMSYFVMTLLTGGEHYHLIPFQFNFNLFQW